MANTFMNSIDAKQKHCIEIKKNCLAEGCMLWSIMKEFPDITSKIVEELFIDGYLIEPIKGKKTSKAFVIRNGKFLSIINVKHMNNYYEDVEIKEIEFSQHVNETVQRRKVPNVLEHYKRDVFYNAETKLWEEKIPPIKQSIGYCGKFRKDFGI